MYRRLLFLLLSSLLLVGCDKDNTYHRIEGFAQGGTFHIVCNPLNGISEEELRQRIGSCLQEIDFTLSGYNKGSMLSRLNAGEDIPLNEIFIDCFTRSKRVWEESNGAFDPSSAPLFELWGFGFSNKGTVTQEAIDSIRAFIGMDLLSLEEREDGVHLVKADPRVKLNFNAVAQGFSCDRVGMILDSLGCTNYLIDIGREILCKGINAIGTPWRIGLDKPIDGNFDEGADLQAIINVTDCGIVTSGNYRNYYMENGQKYSHTIDPATGWPVTHNLLSATVVASDATTADAYATWMMVIGVERARHFLETRADIEGLLVYDRNGDMVSYQTENLKTL